MSTTTPPAPLSAEQEKRYREVSNERQALLSHLVLTKFVNDAEREPVSVALQEKDELLADYAPRLLATLDAERSQREAVEKERDELRRLLECRKAEIHELAERMKNAEAEAQEKLDEWGSIVDRVNDAFLKAAETEKARADHLESLFPRVVEVATNEQKRKCADQINARDLPRDSVSGVAMICLNTALVSVDAVLAQVEQEGESNE